MAFYFSFISLHGFTSLQFKSIASYYTFHFDALTVTVSGDKKETCFYVPTEHLITTI